MKLKISSRVGPWGGGLQYEKVREARRKFELNPYRQPIWVWLELYLTHRYHLKRNRLDYQLLLMKRAYAASW